MPPIKKFSGKTGSRSHCCETSIAAAGSRSHRHEHAAKTRGWQLVFRTANEADMRLSAGICTANIAGVADGEWALIAPYGDHPSPDGSYLQRFDRAQAEKVVTTWNSITGTAARVFKNVMHGLGPKFSTPCWEGHPETDKQRWPKDKLLAEVTDIRTGQDGLEGRVTWNAKGATTRARGPLFPSALWWHWPPSGEPRAVFPELLESIGLVPTPNISGVPAWTANAPFPGIPPEENQPDPGLQHQHHMNHRNQLIALLGLKSDADDSAIQSSLDAHGAKVTSTANALTEAATAKAQLETQLTTANVALVAEQAKATGLTTERDTLTTANTALTTANTALVTGILDVVEKRGAITPAERPAFQTRLATANTAADTLRELQTRKALNVAQVEINGSRVDLSTANARAAVLTSAVQKRMKDDNCGYDEAFAKCQGDPQLKPLFDAMKAPTAAAS